MSRRRSQRYSLYGCLCEDEGYGQSILRRAREWVSKVPGGHADALNRRLGYPKRIDRDGAGLAGMKMVAEGIVDVPGRIGDISVAGHKTIIGRKNCAPVSEIFSIDF